MKKLGLMFLLLQATVLLAASDKQNPADYTVKVYVVFSRYVTGGGYQQIEALIDGERVELVGYSQGVLALGDYSARITPKVHGPKNPNNYDIYKGYEFLMPDGKLRTYNLTAIGKSEFPVAPQLVPPPPSDTPTPIATPEPATPPPPPPPPPPTIP
jgi:hypothetical protein